MKRLAWAWIVVCTVGLCSCSGGAVQPIVIDLSHPPPTPTPTPTAAPAPPPMPTPVPPPAPAPEPPSTVAPPPQAAPMVSAIPERGPEGTVEAQLAAFNRRDLEEYLGFFAPDAVLYEFPDRVLESGIAQVRARYAREFSNAPAARAALVRRIVQGEFVIEQEVLTGLPAGGTSSVLSIREVRAGKVRRVWFLR